MMMMAECWAAAFPKLLLLLLSARPPAVETRVFLLAPSSSVVSCTPPLCIHANRHRSTTLSEGTTFTLIGGTAAIS